MSFPREGEARWSTAFNSKVILSCHSSESICPLASYASSSGISQFVGWVGAAQTATKLFTLVGCAAPTHPTVQVPEEKRDHCPLRSSGELAEDPLALDSPDGCQAGVDLAEEAGGVL